MPAMRRRFWHCAGRFRGIGGRSGWSRRLGLFGSFAVGCRVGGCRFLGLFGLRRWGWQRGAFPSLRRLLLRCRLIVGGLGRARLGRGGGRMFRFGASFRRSGPRLRRVLGALVGLLIWGGGLGIGLLLLVCRGRSGLKVVNSLRLQFGKCP